MSQPRIGVLRGGPSPEFEVSLKTGQNVLANLPEKFFVRDILIDKNGEWFLDGFKISPHKLINKIDLFLNCLHGSYGEDGKVQQILDSIGIPYTGSGIYGSALAMNKFLSKRAFVVEGLKVPEHEVLGVRDDLDSKLREIFQTWFMPVVIKPTNGGSSVGTAVAHDFLEIKKGVADAFNHSSEIMIEEYIRGREATCGVLENFRGEDVYALPVVEIVVAPSSKFFDYNSKYGGGAREVVPGRFSKEEKEEIQRLARLAHKVLGLRHYSRSDFIVSSKGVYILETNSLPGLTPESLYPKSLDAVGLSLANFLEHLIGLSTSRY